MLNKFLKLSLALTAFIVLFSACKKTEYKFGEIVAPANLSITTTIVGVDATNPNGNGSGRVAITVKADKALNYKFDFGDGKSQMVPEGIINYKYAAPGVNDFVITVNAIGTGGAVSTISKKIKLFVAFEIPATILSSLTGATSKIWVTDNGAPGHFGVGPTTDFTPIWYSAPPNTREACAYDDEITFSKDANNNVFMSIDNKGQSMSIGAATSFYGFGGGDGCFAITTGGSRKLSFMDATSASTSANSTRIQFEVPGNGIINFGTGGTTYEILSITNTQMHIRNIGADGNAWYQKLKVK